MNRENTEVDRLVATNIRLRRLLLGMTRRDVAKALGISTQQMEKYESAENRITCGRLAKMAKFLGTNVESFFEGSQKTVDQSTLKITEVAHLKQLIRNFNKLSVKNQRVVHNFISALKKAA